MRVDTDTTRIYTDRFGVKHECLERVYTEYDVGRIRAGYCCIECGEAQEEPFPKECSVCEYPMREQQAHRFGEEFEGYTTIGPSKSLEELRAEDDEIKARSLYAKAKPTSSIWVPGG